MKKLDHLDANIIYALARNARASLANIGKQIGISGPAVGERLRRLEDAQVVDSFGVIVNLKVVGYSLEALVRIKPRSGQLRKVESLIADQPRFLWCDRITGEDCFVAKLALVDVSELDDILFTLHDFAETHTSIVKSSVIRPRLPPLLPLNNE
ncbi:Lrp/AsnC family transcriptional regulator [Alteromonas ponticola]|uniref:Lrp/AsnC family transcriptional regulator n=1 Tax=Alteromonas aquimaris TaxID=2998417 RepID=A0ABT3P2B8_9ALTE|nr:Lrp/AsnC family transcriptional regulator [Alteromonas aquimaris]MCW8106909.1 Lrp/AsnC family transcriptional regulator [Alteromonas aquimaris]